MTETAIGKVIDNDFINTEQAAAIAMVEPSTLVNWRCTKKEKIQKQGVIRNDQPLLFFLGLHQGYFAGFY